MKRDSDMKKYFKQADIGTNVDRDNEVFSKILDAVNKNKTSANPLSTWRIIMKTRITKLAVAAIIIIAAIIGINHFGGSVDGSSIAWADVLTNIQNTGTLSWETTFITEGQTTKIGRFMVLEPHNMRVELEDGKIWTLDHLK